MNKIPGRQKVKVILNGLIKSSKIPHALLFTGIDGAGKEYHAISFAQTVIQNSSSKLSENALRQISQFNEPYIKFIFPLPRGKSETESSSPTEKLTTDEIEMIQEQLGKKIKNPYYKIVIPKANNIKINSIREIKKFLALDYSEITKRFVIISDAHLMNEEAQNALLKNLEEPPDDVIFILCTSQVSRLRQTIISRCWKINFDPLSEEELAEVLKKYFKIDDKIVDAVVPFSEGSVNTALHLIEMDIFKLKEKTISILRYSFGRKFNSAFEELNTLLSDPFYQNYKIVIKMIITWLNDLVKHKYHLKNFFFSDYMETLDKFNTKFPDVELKSIAFKLDRLSSLTKNNINPSLLSANLVFELSSVILKK
jgi:DNA polymerase-3 subunit delta'